MKLFCTFALMVAALTLPEAKRRQPQHCDPYAETCTACKDCSACKHCHVDHGFCSVCLKISKPK